MKQKTHYEILGVNRFSTREEIQAAYRTRVSKVHTDRKGEEYNAKHVDLTLAYNTLKNPTLKEAYDNQLDHTQRFCGECYGRGGTRKQVGFSAVKYVKCEPCKGTGICHT